MKNSTLLGGAASVLLMFSVISYARTYIQQQDQKRAQPPVQSSNQQTNSMAESETAAGPKDLSANAAMTSSDGGKTAAESANLMKETAERFAAPPVTYTATAYSLRGRTASGRPVARGLIAADPRILPLGTRVRIEAGELSGEYLVADTGGAVKGRRVDIWTPTTREAMRFGRRAIRLTVLEFGGRRGNNATRPRTVHVLPANLPVPAAPAKSQN